MNTNIEIFLTKDTDELLDADVLGCDVRVLNSAATVADLMDALDEFAAANLADCRGCDGCCQERAPLIAADIPALNALLGSANAYPAHDVCRTFARLCVNTDGATDIFLRRDADNFCAQLERDGRFCTVWPARPFVCRSHFCLPRSERLEQLRQCIVNMGEDELTRLILAEEAAGAPPLGDSALAAQINAADYPQNGQSGRADYADILLRDCVDDALWRKLSL